MNTHPDDFENTLRALQRHALPAAWRAEILSAKQTPHTPRWLVAGWSVAWAAIVLIYFTTPTEPNTQPRPAHSTPAMRWDERAALIDSLLASN